MTDALDAVIDAALERALVDASDARQYFALAGALERVDRTVDEHVADSGVEPEQFTDGRDDSDDSADERDPGSDGSSNRTVRADPLCASLLSTIAVQALTRRRSDPELDTDAWSPGGDDQWIEFVATGAFAAIRRFDADPDSVAAQSGLEPGEIKRYRRRVRSGE